MKRIYNISILTVIFLLLLSCKEEEKEVKPEKEKSTKEEKNDLNISILMDLSDRIDPEKYPNPTMEYYLRDVGYINSVAEAFNLHLKSKRVRQTNDKMQLFFDPPPLDSQINAISKDLKIEVNKDNISKDFITKIKNDYSEKPLKIYELAIKDHHYVGSDIWKFFKNKVNDYCIQDGYRNILVILTDGYIFYKDTKIKENNATTYLTPELIRAGNLNTSDWEQKIANQKFEFIKANNDLSDLEVLVLGLNPDKKNPYEEDVVKAYWTKWFEAMKVKRYQIRTAELPSEMDNIIKNFVLKQ